VAGASLVLALLAGEVGFRLIETEPWYERLESEQAAGADFEWDLNTEGLRDDDYASPAPEGHYRILFLGDSFTFGSGVDRRRDVFVELLEARLNESPPDPSVGRYDLLNAGRSGAVTGDWIETFGSQGRRFGPDLVIVVFFLRDGTKLGFQKHFFEPLREDLRRWRRESTGARWSALYRFLRGELQRREASEAHVAAYRDAYLGSGEQTVEWRAAQQNLRLLRDRCEADGIDFWFVLFPALFEFGEDYPFQPVCDEIERFCREAALPAFSLLPALQGEDAASLWVSPWDQHPNERGHRLVADALERELRERLAPRR
jgi:lysophospholipase L1-like esterase